MRFVLRDGLKTFELGRPIEGDSPGGGPFRDSTSAEQFLRRFQGDPGSMVKLRQLTSHVSGPGFHRLGDDEMIRFLARKMAHSQISFLTWERPRMEGFAAPPAAAAASAPAQRAPASSPAPAPPAEPSLFPATFDAIAQVAALTSAAQSGTPFCEECEKARRAREAA